MLHASHACSAFHVHKKDTSKTNGILFPVTRGQESPAGKDWTGTQPGELQCSDQCLWQGAEVSHRFFGAAGDLDKLEGARLGQNELTHGGALDVVSLFPVWKSLLTG